MGVYLVGMMASVMLPGPKDIIQSDFPGKLGKTARRGSGAYQTSKHYPALALKLASLSMSLTITVVSDQLGSLSTGLKRGR